MTLLYCARSWRVSATLTLAAAGRLARPLTCPPLTEETFPYERLAVARLAYVRLHGLPQQPYLYGDDWLTAMSARRLRGGPRLQGTVVILEGCFGAGMAEVFVEMGAAAVVANDGETVNRTLRLGPAGWFGRDVVKALDGGACVGRAVEWAKGRRREEFVERYRVFGRGDIRY